MARHDVTLQAIYDDVARTVTISGQGSPPPPPAGFEGMWVGQTGPGFEFVVNVQSKNITAVPIAMYVVPNSEPVEWRQVEFRNGAWQMPGVIVTG